MRDQVLQSANITGSPDNRLGRGISLYHISGGLPAAEIWHALFKQRDLLGAYPVILGNPAKLYLLEDGLKKAAPARELLSKMNEWPAEPIPILNYGKEREAERMAEFDRRNPGKMPPFLLNYYTNPVLLPIDPPEMSFENWPEVPARGATPVQSVLDSYGQGPLEQVILALIDDTAPTDIAARLNFGGFNSCPEPLIHVAVARAWNLRHGAVPICMSHDVIEFYVPHPPTTPADCRKLAWEQKVYSEAYEGAKTEAIAQKLWHAPYWFCWWD